jgi:hypothetical protein
MGLRVIECVLSGQKYLVIELVQKYWQRKSLQDNTANDTETSWQHHYLEMSLLRGKTPLNLAGTCKACQVSLVISAKLKLWELWYTLSRSSAPMYETTMKNCGVTARESNTFILPIYMLVLCEIWAQTYVCIVENGDSISLYCLSYAVTQIVNVVKHFILP